MTRPWEYQPWFAPYQRALDELNTDNLPERIRIAESAIKVRIAALSRSRDELELKALHNALQVLCLLQEFRSISAAPLGRQ